MKRISISKDFLLSLFLVSIIPLVGYAWSLLKLRRSNARLLILAVCFFDFFLALKVPPYQDLFRRYTETYYSYYPGMSLWNALEGKIDFLFYINSFVFYKLKLPFFLIPAIYSSLTVYNIYSSYLKIYDNSISVIGENKSRFLIASIVVISFVNVVGIATTLRFGFAASMMINGIIEFYFGKKRKSYLLAATSILMHASMIIPAFSVLAASFLKINRLSTILLSVICLGISNVLIKYILISFNPFGLGTYFLVGYVDSSWASFSTDISTLFFISVQYIVILYFFLNTMKSAAINKGYANFINVFAVICFSLTISITVFNRFFNGMFLYFLMFYYLNSKSYISKHYIIKIALIGLIFYNLLFINVYVQRRPIMLGRMYTALYTPPIMNIFYTMTDFNNYLKKINGKGDWIGHELGK